MRKVNVHVVKKMESGNFHLYEIVNKYMILSTFFHNY